MYRKLVIISVLSTLVLASPGNLGYGVGLGSTGYGGNQLSVASGSASVSAVAATPVAVAPAVVAPIATSVRGRVDVITPNQVVNQVSVVPAAPIRAVSLGGYGGIVAGSAGLVGGGFGNGGYGNGGYGNGGYGNGGYGNGGGVGYVGNRAGGYGY